MTVRAVCIGAGGHAAVVIEAARAHGEIEIVGVVDKNEALWGQSVVGYRVVGGDEQLARLRADGVVGAIIAVGSTRSCAARAQVFATVTAADMKALEVIHPRAYVSPSVNRGAGLIVLPMAVVHTRARLGDNVLVNSGACVEHDCVIGDHSHVATGCVLAGTVQIGARTHIGAGAVVREGIRIGSDAVIGAGAVVVKDVDDGDVVVGNPAKVLRASAFPRR